MLWPRFELILEMNVQSVRSTDPQRLGGLDTRPHYVSQGEGLEGRAVCLTVVSGTGCSLGHTPGEEVAVTWKIGRLSRLGRQVGLAGVLPLSLS